MVLGLAYVPSADNARNTEVVFIIRVGCYVGCVKSEKIASGNASTFHFIPKVGAHR